MSKPSKKLRIILTSLALTISVPMFASAEGLPTKLDSISSSLLIVDDSATNSIDILNKRSEVDENVAELMSQFNLNTLSSTLTDAKVSKQAEQIIAVEYNELATNLSLQSQIKQALKDQVQVYIYGEALTVKDVEELLEISIEPGARAAEEKGESYNPEIWQVLGLKYVGDKLKVHFGSTVTYKDSNSEETSVSTEDQLLQSILNNVLDEQKATKNEKTESLITPMGYSDDPIVSSEYNITSSIYVGSQLVGTLNQDWILHQNLDSDNDSNYDYFYLEDSIEGNAYNAGVIYDLRTKHDLPYKSSDEIRDWGPGSNSGSSFTVSLPWGVSWEFDSHASISLETDGSQTNDWASWNVNERLWQYNISSPARIKPGTAWASSASSYGPNIAAINTEAKLSIRESGGISLKHTTITKEIKYAY